MFVVFANYAIYRKDNYKNIRIDTHENNVSMNAFLKNKGFKYCGIISLTLDYNDKKSLRNAYHFVL